MKLSRLALVFLSLPICVETGLASRPYEPTEGVDFDASWRWRELEALSPYTVRQVDRAPDGTLWFAIHGGILEFDGYEATPHWFEDAGRGEVSALAIKVASDGSIYVLARDFVARFREGVWRRYDGVWKNASTGSLIDESADGSIWVVARSGVRSNPDPPVLPPLRLYQIIGDDLKRIDDVGSVSGLRVDRKNRLWLSNADTGEILRYELDWSSGDRIGEPWRIATEKYVKMSIPYAELQESPSGRMWIAIDSETEALRVVGDDTVETVLADWSDFSPSNRLLAEMSDGSLWVASSRVLGQFDKGAWNLKRMDSQANWFTFLYNLENDVFITGGHTDKTYLFDVSRKRWNSFEGLNFGCQESDGTTWFLSEDRRVVRFDPKENSWTSFGPEDGLIDTPNAMLATAGDRIWVSGSHAGEAAVSWLDGDRWRRDAHPEISERFGHAAAYEGNDGYIYFASNVESWKLSGLTGGIIRYRDTGREVEYVYLLPPDYPMQTFELAQMSNGDLWTGGQSLFRTRSGQRPEQIGGFQRDLVDNVVVDSNDALWIGDWRSGVSRFVDGKWERLSISEGRARDQLVSLLAVEGSPGIWAATTDGLSRFDGHSWSPHTRFSELKLQREGARLHASIDGNIWINSATRSWNLNTEPEPLDEQVAFKTIRYALDSDPPETRIDAFESRLPESGNAYFEWSGMDAWSRTWSKDLEYSYRLNGGSWAPFQKEGQVSIPSLAPGNYRLEVRARDADWNIDPTPASVEFTVVPFLWKRPWFLGTVLLTIALIGALVYLLIRTRVRHILALEEFKIDFFTNISHELRTPLAVILGPLERILQRHKSEDVWRDADMAYRNARKMQGLVDQLLEFRKVELGKLKYEPIRSDIVLFLKDTIFSHASLWEKKRQGFELDCDLESLVCCFDPDKLQHIVGNLLSNAIKYTHDGGEIAVKIGYERSANGASPSADSSEVESIVVTVSDTGIGIEPGRQELIFKPFYRARDNDRDHTGSGIGLAYTYELVQLWGGEISVESPIPGRGSNAGSRFTLRLPLIEIEDAPLAEDPLEIQNTDTELESDFEGKERRIVVVEKTISERNRPLVLVVEDNSDVRSYLERELFDNYDIMTANDGQSGLVEASRNLPDLIVTDLMMPVMDGLEMCSRLKTQTETSHIPIIVLTARVSDEFRLKGIENGADDYFSKPVKIGLLKARIESALDSRRLLQERFAKQIMVQPSEVTVTSTDEVFLRRAMALVEERMRDETFDVVTFAKKMGTSRGTLLRKLKAITGESPSDFIRSMRLKRAAQLLETGRFTVSEMLEHVGILDLSYFGKIFRACYGMSPTEYKKSVETKESANAE